MSDGFLIAVVCGALSLLAGFRFGSLIRDFLHRRRERRDAAEDLRRAEAELGRLRRAHVERAAARLLARLAANDQRWKRRPFTNPNKRAPRRPPMSDAPDFTPDSRDERDSTLARFYLRPMLNKSKSDAAGRPVHEDQEFVEIHVPGDRKTVVDTFVKEEHRRRWPRAYAAFKAGMEAPLEGTALEDWAGISRSQVEELRFAHVRTVEALANLSDDQLNKTVSMGGFALRERATRFLADAAGSAPMEKLAAENEVLKANMAETNGKVEALMAEVARLTRLQPEAAPPVPPPVA